MVLRATPVSLAPREDEVQVIVSRKKLDRLVQKNQRQGEEIAPLQKEARKKDRKIQDLEHQLAIFRNPNVPPSVRHHTPGFLRSHTRASEGGHQRLGTQCGHEDITREPMAPDEWILLTAGECTRCHGHRLRLRGTVIEQEVEVEHLRKITEYSVHVYECADCGETLRSRLQTGSEPAGDGPQLQTDIVMDKIEGLLPYRRIEDRLGRQGIPTCPAAL